MARQSKAKAKKDKKQTTPGKLAGKTVAFVGKFGYDNRLRKDYEAYVAAEGGSVVDIEAVVPDYLVVGEGRDGNPPAAASQFRKKNSSAPVFDEADFCRFLLPTPDELAAVLRSGEHEHEYWLRPEALISQTKATIDLSGGDSRLYNKGLSAASCYEVDKRGMWHGRCHRILD